MRTDKNRQIILEIAVFTPQTGQLLIFSQPNVPGYVTHYDRCYSRFPLRFSE